LTRRPYALAEITLALVLFAAACQVNARTFASYIGIPFRLRGIGLPVTLGAEATLAVRLFTPVGPVADW
jgi:hypothetical protein